MADSQFPGEKIKMQVVISGGGRFHLFELAKQLLIKDALSRLITSYPRYKAIQFGLPPDKVKSILAKEIIFRGWGYLPAFLRTRYNPQYLSCEIFDRLARTKLSRCDIFVGLSSFSLHTMNMAKLSGCVTILERGSAHILAQQDILREEYDLFGLPFAGAHPKVVEKELAEYDAADWIFVPSEFAKRTFVDKGIDEAKLVCIPYGVDLSFFRQVQKNDRVFRVIFCGNMSLQKGVHYLLRAFSELKLPASELLLIGNLPADMKPFFKKYAGSYKWIGPVPHDILYRYYSQGSVFVMNSIQEGMAMVQLEAMACGLPLVCTTNTGGDDIISEGNEGFVIPIRDVEALKEKLLYLYENRVIAEEMGERARAKVSRGFSWDDYGSRVMKQYTKILESGGCNDRL